MSKRVLVFGATGEIGGRIAQGCVKAGHHVVGVTRGSNTRARCDLEGVEMVHGDKNDEAFIKDLGCRFNAEVVIDSVPRGETIRSLHAHFRQVQNVLLCSSTGTFVPLESFPADEAHPWREATPVNFHHQSVLDAYALDLWEQKRFPVTILRPTNIIGRDRVPLDLWGGRNIEFFRKLKRNEPVTIPDCENVLVQPGYNTDLADAFVKAIDHPEAVRGEIFIISCKKAITLGRYLRTAMDYLKSQSEISHASPEELCGLYPDIRVRFGLEFLLEHMCFDIGKAERLIGYEPSRTAEEGLVEALEWCEETGLL